MVVYINKNFIEVRPILFPDCHLVVIAYSNIVEVQDNQHNVIWKIEEKSKIVKLELYSTEEEKITKKFYIALQEGEVKLCDISTKVITDVFHGKTEVRNVFINNNDILTVENDGIKFYPRFDLSSMKIISTKVFKNMSYSKKTGIIGMVEKDILLVLCLNSDKTITHHLPRYKKTITFTAVACHPTEQTMATADSSGKIQLWWDVLNPSKRMAVFHWHFLSLNTLEFNCDGTHLLSGGREQVLVKWELSITDSERKKTFLPRLESDIQSIQSFHGEIGEHYLITLADNSYQIVNTAMRSIDKYANVVQRSEILHNKISKSCPMNPIGLKSCHNFPPKLSSSIILNGHEGKLQFFDLMTKSTRYQLDAACQNWPTETENHLIPGFIQIKSLATSNGGRCIATYESLGIAVNEFDNQRFLKMFRWNDESEIYELESTLQFDWLDKISEMIFHPVKEDYLVVVTNSLRLVLLSRRVKRDLVEWNISHIFDLEEVLYRFKIKIKTEYKNHPSKLVTTMEMFGKDVDGLLVITKGDCLMVYEWNRLLMFNTKPAVAVTVNTLMEDLEIDGDQENKFSEAITSSAIFRSENTIGCYRIVIGLQYGLIVIESTLHNDLSVELRSITSALSKYPVKSLAACPSDHDSNAQVAVLFENSDHLTIFSVWDDNAATSQTMSVPDLEQIVWVSTINKSWTLVGLKCDGNLRSIVLCDNEAVQHFTDVVTKIEPQCSTRNLLSMADDVEDAPALPITVKRNFHKRMETNFLLYYPESAPSASMILNAMYSI